VLNWKRTMVGLMLLTCLFGAAGCCERDQRTSDILILSNGPEWASVRFFMIDDTIIRPMPERPVRVHLVVGRLTSDGVELYGRHSHVVTQEALVRTIARLSKHYPRDKDLVIILLARLHERVTLEALARAMHRVVTAARAAKTGRKVNLVVSIPGIRSGTFVSP